MVAAATSCEWLLNSPGAIARTRSGFWYTALKAALAAAICLTISGSTKVMPGVVRAAAETIGVIGGECLGAGVIGGDCLGRLGACFVAMHASERPPDSSGRSGSVRPLIAA